MWTLVTSDGTKFEDVAEPVLELSKILHDAMLVAADCGEQEIPIPGVDASHLSALLKFGTAYVAWTKEFEDDIDDDAAKKEAKGAIDAAFIPDDMTECLKLLDTCNFLHMSSAFDVLTAHVRASIEGRSPEELRELFTIVNDYTPEEEAEGRAQKAWAFETLPGYKLAARS